MKTGRPSRRRLGALSFFYLTLCLTLRPPALQAQPPAERFIQERLTENLSLHEKERYLERELKEKAILVQAKKFLFDFGGWVDVNYTEFHNDDNDRGTKDIFDADLSIDTRLWVEGIFRPRLGGSYVYEHTIYAQFRNFYISRWPNEEQPAVQDDNNGPHVDLLYLDLDLQYANLRVGRQYLALGQGISYLNVHDGIQLKSKLQEWEGAGFVATTLPYEENIDFSVPGFDKKSERYFVGTELAWIPTERWRFYGYFLAQKDESNPDPATGQDFAYDSQYWSLGTTLSDFHGFSSWGEYILESGSSAVFGTNDRNPVLAQAFNLGLRYEFSWLTHPDFTLEYAYGSGDKDRVNVTNTEGGNRNGEDHNFLSFGYYPAGYALSPTLSNIQILALKSSVRPLEKVWQLKKFTIGVNGYFYWKDEVKGGIYDPDATQKGRTIGQEVDFTLYWPVLSDVIVSVRYGMFFPGSAYPATSDDPENYLSSTLTFSF